MRKRARNHKVQGNLRNAWLDELNSDDCDVNWLIATENDWCEYKTFTMYEPQGKQEARKMVNWCHSKATELE